MSERNVELLRRAIETYNARDLEAFIAYFDPSSEVQSAFAAVGGGVYHGHAGLRGLFRDLQDAWGDEIHIEPDAYFDLGESTLVFSVLYERGRHSGVDVEMPNALVARWREDVIVYLKSYLHREEVLSDLGISEDELEPIAP